MLNDHDETEWTRAADPVRVGRDGVSICRLALLFRNGTMTYRQLDGLRDHLRESRGSLVLDFTGVEHVTSAGIGMLAALYTAAREHGRSIVLAAPGPRVAAILRVARFTTLIETRDRVEDAVRAALRDAAGPAGSAEAAA